MGERSEAEVWRQLADVAREVARRFQKLDGSEGRSPQDIAEYSGLLRRRDELAEEWSRVFQARGKGSPPGMQA